MAKSKKQSRLEQSTQALLRNGRNAFAEGDYETAIDAWERAGRQIKKKQPKEALAEAYFRHGLSLPAAEQRQAFEKALEYRPDDHLYRYHLALAAHRQDDLDTAVEIYQNLWEKETDLADRVAYSLAQAHMTRGEDVQETAVWEHLSEDDRQALQMPDHFQRRPYDPPADAGPFWRGLAAYDDGEYDTAREHLTAVLTEEPSAADVASFYLGAIAAEKEDWTAAVNQWLKAEKEGLDTDRLTENLGEAYHRLAEGHMADGRIDDARKAAQKAARYKEDDNQLNLLLSHLYHHRAYSEARSKSWDAAIRYWRKAEKRDGGSFRIAYNLALAHEKQESYEQAAERWREAIRRKPRSDDHPDAMSDETVARLWKQTADAYTRAGDYAEAARVYNLAVKWQPDNLNIRLARAESLFTDGRFQAAENELERILKRDPNHIPALLMLGDVIQESTPWWRARYQATNKWERVLEIDPKNEAAKQRLVDYYLQRAEDAQRSFFPDEEEALTMYERALEYDPQNGRIEASIAQLYLVMGEMEEARPYIEQAITHAPGDWTVYGDIILGLFEYEAYDEAEKMMDRAEKNIPDLSPIMIVTVGATLLYDQNIDEARKWFNRAIEKSSATDPVYGLIGHTFIEVPIELAPLGLEYLEKAVEKGVEVGRAYTTMGILHARMEDDRTADKYWRKAERIARREKDDNLREYIEYARQVFTGIGSSLFGKLFGGGGFPSDIFD